MRADTAAPRLPSRGDALPAHTGGLTEEKRYHVIHPRYPVCLHAAVPAAPSPPARRRLVMNKTLLMSALLLASAPVAATGPPNRPQLALQPRRRRRFTGSTPWIRATSAMPPKTTWGWTSSPSMRKNRAAHRAQSPSAPRSSRTWGAPCQGRKIAHPPADRDGGLRRL